MKAVATDMKTQAQKIDDTRAKAVTIASLLDPNVMTALYHLLVAMTTSSLIATDGTPQATNLTTLEGMLCPRAATVALCPTAIQLMAITKLFDLYAIEFKVVTRVYVHVFISACMCLYLHVFICTCVYICTRVVLY
jgi:hypothetical protein